MGQAIREGKGRMLGYAGIIILLLLPLGLPRFLVYTVSLIMLFGLLATSNNFALGFGGIYQLHHCVFYGIGAYGAAVVLTKTGISPWIGFVAGPVVAAILSLVMGLICVRLSKLYFGMLQIALGSLAWAVIYRWRSFTGGEDGIHGIPVPDLISSSTGAYYFTFLVVAASMFVIYKILKAPFGIALQGIRDNPVRSEMIGVNVRRHQLAALIICGFFAGVAGVLFVVVDSSVFPGMMFWALSMEVVIMCLLGGWLTFMGPMVGAALIISIRTFVSSYTEYWSLILGIILMAVIFFLPSGILGYVMGKFAGKLDKQPAKR
ncbi:MAG TPA: branched-chain amino acid ABC transporter permease [Syntrophorhabdaceae bacterium]|nr:branched-chain amino acid ABC transporter permease [Syntrophorhabdaceae bacterium]